MTLPLSVAEQVIIIFPISHLIFLFSLFFFLLIWLVYNWLRGNPNHTKAHALGHISDFTQSLIPNSQDQTKKGPYPETWIFLLCNTWFVSYLWIPTQPSLSLSLSLSLKLLTLSVITLNAIIRLQRYNKCYVYNIS